MGLGLKSVIISRSSLYLENIVDSFYGNPELCSYIFSLVTPDYKLFYKKLPGLFLIWRYLRFPIPHTLNCLLYFLVIEQFQTRETRNLLVLAAALKTRQEIFGQGLFEKNLLHRSFLAHPLHPP